jgi:hypothetical protein
VQAALGLNEFDIFPVEGGWGGVVSGSAIRGGIFGKLCVFA